MLLYQEFVFREWTPVKKINKIVVPGISDVQIHMIVFILGFQTVQGLNFPMSQWNALLPSSM
jgi:hypothetical protein